MVRPAVAKDIVQTIAHRQGLKAGCLEEIAYRAGWITAEALSIQAEALAKTGFGEYLRRMLEESR
ncbi:hypothetical protein F6455_05500 [Proteobacteria bacterium 005FR1]|nr:hypothetical protein [Proteobacteria bacterium 005FR1]